MKAILCAAAVLFACASGVRAEEPSYHKRIQVWYWTNTAEWVELDDVVTMYQNKDGRRFEWKRSRHPKKGELDKGIYADAAVINTVYADYLNSRKADVAQWTKRELALVKVFLFEINQLRARLGLTEMSLKQLSEAIAKEM